MIYMVDHVYTDPTTEPAWHEWYAGYLQKLVSVPGIDTAQRFKAIDCSPPRYLAMYSIESADVYTSAPYKNIGGGGSQSARFHYAYAMWTRNLFDGASQAPAIEDGQRVLVFDRERRNENGPLASRAIWLEAVGLHMTTRFRAFVVLDAAEAAPTPLIPGSFMYEPFTAVIASTAK
ncbi:MAG: sugar transporter [Betaproteobacteria bacterium]|jgi:hypothetical protein|nr:sugar transporter [Betaproteobacteria bacterium]